VRVETPAGAHGHPSDRAAVRHARPPRGSTGAVVRFSSGLHGGATRQSDRTAEPRPARSMPQ
jgi:hypothetical protein